MLNAQSVEWIVKMQNLTLLHVNIFLLVMHNSQTQVTVVLCKVSQINMSYIFSSFINIFISKFTLYFLHVCYALITKQELNVSILYRVN